MCDGHSVLSSPPKTVSAGCPDGVSDAGSHVPRSYISQLTGSGRDGVMDVLTATTAG